MIDIVEAGKFYLECLKKVHESILEQDILPKNEILNTRADIMQYQGLGKKVVGVFDLNGRTHTFEVDVGPTDSKRDILRNTISKVANIIADAAIINADWGSGD